MPETFIFIAGRTARQGTTLNEGKYTDGYVEETSTLLVNAADMKRLELANGDHVRLISEHGQCEVVCQTAKGDEVPSGLLFMAYGHASSLLMGGETHGTGMPSSKGIDVRIEKISHPGEPR